MNYLITIVCGFATGIFFRSELFTSWWPVYYVLFLAALFGAAFFLKQRLGYSLGVVFFICVALGMLRFALSETPLPRTFASDLRHRVTYEAVVVGDPDVREKNQRIPLQVTKGDETVGVLAVMPLTTHVAVGDRVKVSGTLYVPMAFESENGRTFRYDKFLEARGQRFLMQYGSLRVTRPAPWDSLPAALAKIKHTFLDGLHRALPEPASALAGGIVIGGKSGLPPALQDSFIRSGLVQIVVLSGYNVMIVAEWVMLFLAALWLPRRIQFVAGGAALLLFIGIAGISTTAIRATIMALIALYARATGKSYAASRALLVTIVLMLLYNPLLLCYDPGFVLSVAATAGIIWLSPIIERFIEKRVRAFKIAIGRAIFQSAIGRRACACGGVCLVQRHPPAPTGAGSLSETLPHKHTPASRPSFISNAIATTLAAQLSVLPLLLYMSGLLSFVALPANILVNPLVPFAMAAAAIAGVSGMLLGTALPTLLHIVSWPALALTCYIIAVAQKSAALPYATLTLHQFPFWLVVASYAVLISIVLVYKEGPQGPGPSG